MRESEHYVRTVELTEDEIKLCNIVAKSRQGANVKNVIKNQRRSGKLNDLECHQLGAQGEKAFCVIFQCLWLSDLGTFRAYDATVNGLGTVDVKTTETWGEELLETVPTRPKVWAQYYALIIRDKEIPSRFYYMGMVTAQELVEHLVPEFGPKKEPRYVVPQIDLQRIIPEDL